MQTVLPQIDVIDANTGAVALHRYRLFDHEVLSRKLVAAAYDERHRDSNGADYGDKGWHSMESLHLEARYAELLAVFDAAVARCWASAGWSAASHPWQPSALWVNISGPGTRTPEHAHWAHAGSVFSGVYYASVPSGSGNFRARSKDMYCATMGSYELAELTPFEVSYWLDFEPKPGELILMPNWLWHSVGVNRSAEDRIAWTVMFQLSHPIPRERGSGWRTSDAHPRWHAIIAEEPPGESKPRRRVNAPSR